MADEGKTGEEQEKAAQEEDEIKVMAKPRAEVFEVAFGDEQPKKNLQEAFLRYRRKLQKEVKKSRKRRDVADENRLRAMADPDNMWRLRMKFLDQARKYFGVPYAKKYWTDQDPEFRSRWFLDCCGLVRRCMRDLKKDFGFKIGPWNQAYMYDTLPHTILESQVKPGDLVFISAIYHSPKKKKQRHNITHVEIMTGEGPQTIGSRWNKGHVQIFDSYRFKPEAYHSEQYIFKSLDTWLMGICRSFCREHRWRTRAETFKPGKHSVFSVPEQQQNKQNQQADENASDSSDETVMLTSRSEGIVAKTPSQVLGSKDSNQGVISQQLQDKGSIGEEGSSMDERSDDEEDEDDEDDQDVDAIHQSESETEDDCPQRPATSTGTYNVRQTDNMVEKIKDDQKVTQDVLKVDELNKTQEDSSCDISNVLSNLELNDNSARVLEHNKPNSDDHSQASFDSRNTYTKNSDNNEQEVANLNNNNNLNDERSKAEDEAEHLKWLEEETNINANNNTSGSSTPQDGDVREKQAAGTTQGWRL